MHELIVAARAADRAASAPQEILASWKQLVPSFVRVMPNDYRRVLEAQAKMRRSGLSPGGGRDGGLRAELAATPRAWRQVRK